MKKTILLLCTLTFALHANITMTKSKHDKRIVYYKFNGDDVFKIKALDGFVTIIELQADERVVTAGTGFNEGWNITSSDNYVHIRPQVYKSDESVVFPDMQWNTNMFITTNKRTYLGDLILADKDSLQYKISFSYPNVARSISNQKKLNKELDKTTIPKNWAFYMKVNKGSDSIIPNFVYDDGVFTYLGFDKTKTFPSVFETDGEQENILNTHSKSIGNYDVLVVHKLVKILLLRSGSKLVGVLNAGYGKNPNYQKQDTSSPKIKREIIGHE